jgi:hypothetical protein
MDEEVETWMIMTMRMRGMMSMRTMKWRTSGMMSLNTMKWWPLGQFLLLITWERRNEEVKME